MPKDKKKSKKAPVADVPVADAPVANAEKTTATADEVVLVDDYSPTFDLDDDEGDAFGVGLLPRRSALDDCPPTDVGGVPANGAPSASSRARYDENGVHISLQGGKQKSQLARNLDNTTNAEVRGAAVVQALKEDG